MSQHPVVLDDDTGWLTTRQAAKAQRFRRQAELEVYRHGVVARAHAAMDQQDSLATADAARVALEEEIAFLSGGLALAGQSAAGRELVARKVELLANINSRRLVRRFGA